MIRKFSFLVLLCWVVETVAEPLEQTGLEWLRKMQVAMKSLNYHGTVAFMENGQLDTMKYFHAAKDGREQERLLSLNSPMREVIRDSGKVSCTYQEARKRVINHRPVSRSFIIDLPPQVAKLEEIYTISVAGEESIAMRTAAVIKIEPKDEFRYSRKIWLDKQQYLPLKVEVFKHDGTALEQVMFTDITIEAELPFVALNNPDIDLDVQHIHQAQSESFENALFSLNNLPKGFEKVFFTRLSMQQTTQPVDHLLLSDGFSSISIYLDGKNEKIENGLHHVGSVNSYSFTQDDIQVTVMGEVPANTVQFIAQGIHFNP